MFGACARADERQLRERDDEDEGEDDEEDATEDAEEGAAHEGVMTAMST